MYREIARDMVLLADLVESLLWPRRPTIEDLSPTRRSPPGSHEAPLFPDESQDQPDFLEDILIEEYFSLLFSYSSYFICQYMLSDPFLLLFFILFYFVDVCNRPIF